MFLILILYKMNNIQKFKLSEEHIVYKIKYNEQYNKDSFIKRIYDNRGVIYKKPFKHVEDKILIKCDEFKSVDDYVIKALEVIENKEIKKFAKSSWVYTQKKDFNMVMHNHIFLEMGVDKTKLKTDWTCVFYIQIPKNIKEGEGDIIFMTEDKKMHIFKPEENEIIIFSGKLYHMVTQIPNAEIDRIIYAANFNFNLKID
jgi:hypothetical protein